MDPPSVGLRVQVPGAIDTNDAWASEPPSPPVSPGGGRRRRAARTLTITGKKNLTQGVCGNVWVHNDDSWKLLHRFSTGLELDSESPGDDEGLMDDAPRAQLHLPSTSLMVLEQLQACLRNRRCVEMDVHLEDTNQSNDLTDVLLRLVESQASLTAAARTEVRSKLTQRRQGHEPPSPGSHTAKAGGEEQMNHLAPSQLIEPAAGQEAIDVAICPVSGLEASSFTDGHRMALGLAKLASTLDMDGATGRVPVKYAALVICPQADAFAYEEAHQLACTVAATFMDENFAGTVRSLPRERPEGLLAALDEYLSSITIVPTVYLARKQQNDAEGVAEQIAYYLLAESLVQSMEKKLCRQRGLNFSSFDLHGALRAREKMNRRQFFFQVSKFLPLEDDWTVTHRLRQGLEVESNLDDARPQMPSVSVSALTQVRQLMTPSSVALNICCGGAEQATKIIVEQLGQAGLPPNALEDVSHALNTVSNKPWNSRTSEKFELLEPSQGDEACHVFVVPSVQLPPHNGFMGAFLRFSPALGFPFAPLDLPIRFLFMLVGPQSSEAELLSLGHSLAVLSTDEDLMSGLTQVGDNSAFVNAIDMRLGNLTFIPHAYLTTKSAVSPSSAGSWDSRPVELAQTHHGEEEMVEPLSPKTNRSVKSGRSQKSGSDSESGGPPKMGRSSQSSSSSGLTNISAALKAMDGAHGHKEGKWNFRKCMRLMVAKLQKYSVPLVVGVTTALVWSNIDEHSYHSFTHGQVSDWKLVDHEVSLHFLVNDIFMCFFFGLAIKEVAEAVLPGGSLSPIRRAANPLLATVGGVVGPVATYYVMVSIMQAAGSFEDTLCEVSATGTSDHRRLGGGGGSSASSGPKTMEVCSLGTLLKGWGVPTATDISLAWMFALLVFGAGHPAINVLLLLAIVDDALGMVIIAIFYPNPEKPVEPVWLLLVLLAMVLAFVLRKLQCAYWLGWVLIPGPVSWLGLIKAHVHPALALVFVVPFMPAVRPRRKGKAVAESTDGPQHRVSKAVAKVVDMLDTTGGTTSRNSRNSLDGHDDNDRAAVVQRAAEAIIHHAQAPLHAFEHSLKLPVDLGMFFFGLANAGVQLGAVGGITWSVLGALLVGKTLGIAGFGMLAMSMGFSLPTGVTIVDLFAMSALGGIGLTVALFVANEAFVDPGLQAQAKMGAVLSVGCCFFAWLIKFVGDKIIKQPYDEETAVFITDLTVDGEDEEMGDVEAGEWLDDFLVEDIMQIMWTHRQYRLRGMKMPMNRASIRAASKEVSGGHRRLSGRLDGPRASTSSLDLGGFLRRTSSACLGDAPDQPNAVKDGLGPYNSEDSTDPRNFKGLTDGQLNGDGSALTRQTSPALSVSSAGSATKNSRPNSRA